MFKPCSRSKRCAINGALLLLLLLQIIVAKTIFHKKVIPIPEFVSNKIIELIHEQDIALNIQTSYFSLDGCLLFKNLRATSTITKLRLANVDQLLLFPSFNIFKDNFIGSVKFLINNAKIFAPNQEALINNLNCSLNLRHKSLRINNIIGEYENLKFSLHSPWDNRIHVPSLPKTPKTRKKPSKHWETAFSKFTETIQKQTPLIHSTNNPVCHLTLAHNKDSFDINLNASTSGLSSIDKFTFGKTKIKSDISWKGASAIFNRLHLSSQKLNWNKKINIQSPVIESQSSEFQISNIPSISSQIAIHRIQTNNIEFKNLYAHTSNSIDNLNSIQYQLSAFLERSPLTASGTFHPLNQELDIKIKTELIADDLLKLPIPEKRKPLISRFNFPEPIHLEAASIINTKGISEKVDFSINTRNCKVLDVNLTEIDGKGTWHTTGIIEAQKIDLYTERYHAQGAVMQNLKNKDFRLLVKGTLFPSDIDPWLDNWWDRLWPRFTIQDKLPYADFDIQFRWFDPMTRFIYGHVDVDNVAYRDFAIEKGDLKLIYAPKYLGLHDMHVYNPEGEATGEIIWVLHPTNRKAATSRRVNIQGSLFTETAGSIFEKEIGDAIRAFQCTAPPKLSINAAFFTDQSADIPDIDRQHILDIEADMNAPLTYYDIPFNSLQFKTHMVGETINVEHLLFDYAKGKGEGTVKYNLDHTDPTPLEVDLSLKDADKYQFIHGIPFLRDTLSEEDLQISKDIKTSLAVTLKAKGPPEDLYKFKGEGSIELTDPHLSKVYILGVLSHLLEVLPIAKGSISFRSVEAKFKLNEDTLDFSKFILKSPSHRLNAEGNFFLNDRTLDFMARLHFLGEIKIPIIKQVLNIFDPVAHFLEFNLTGTFKEPKWRFTIDPRNLLNPKKKPTENKSRAQPKKRK